MLWEIKGADKDTGREVAIQVAADTEEAARDLANRKGILVSSAFPVQLSESAAIDSDVDADVIRRPRQSPHDRAPQSLVDYWRIVFFSAMYLISLILVWIGALEDRSLVIIGLLLAIFARLLQLPGRP